MANFRSWVLFIGFCVLILALEPKLPALAADSGSVGGVGSEVWELCDTDLRSFLPPPYANLSGVICKPVWNTFILRVSLILL